MANSVSLLEDAKLLLDNGSAGRARSLIILAQRWIGWLQGQRGRASTRAG
jgi:hypothetical protein